jgi:hypothetical protein
MGATFTFPDLNAPAFVLDKRLPVVTRWMVFYGIIALIVWLIFYLLDRNNHKNHRKRHDRLKRKLDHLEARLAEQFKS